jgi:hypothetical protein
VGLEKASGEGCRYLDGFAQSGHGRWLDPVAAKDIAHRLIGDGIARIGESSDDVVVAPAGIPAGEVDNERFQFWLDLGPAWGTTELGAVEFAGNEPPVASEDGLGLGDPGELPERSATAPFADVSDGGSFGIGRTHPVRKVRSQDPILGDQMFILEQEFLIDQRGDVGQQPSPFAVWRKEHPS